MSERAIGFRLRKHPETGIYWVRYRVNGERISASTETTDRTKAEERARSIVSDSVEVITGAPAPAPSPIVLPLLVGLLAVGLFWAIYEFSFKPSVEEFRRAPSSESP